MSQRKFHGRFRPVGTRRPTVVPYSPAGTGCPVVERAIQGLYRAQNEESFWTLMSALNYALEINTYVLVPVQTALTVHNAPAPWTEHPIPAERSGGLPLWILRSEKGRNWLPVFTSSRTAAADRSTAARPMSQHTLRDALSLALETEGVDGVVIDPWGSSATLDASLLNGLLHAERMSAQPGEAELEAGRAAAAKGEWKQAVEALQKGADAGCPEALTRLAACMYWGQGTRKDKAGAKRAWKQAAEAGDPLALVALGDDARSQDPGKALLYYRQAIQLADRQPDVEYMPYVCLRIAQQETRYISPRQALAQAAEAAQGFRVLLAEGDPTAGEWLRQAETLMQELSVPPTHPNAYKNQ